MEITIDDAIQHIKNSCYIVGYPTHDKQQETRKRVNASLDMAIEIMRKYEKIEQIMKETHEGYITKYQKIEEVIKDGDDTTNAGSN